MAIKIEKANYGFCLHNQYAKSEKHPKWKGFANIDGVQKEIAIWERTTEAGKPMLSINFQSSEETSQYKTSTLESISYTDEDLPF